MGGSASTICSPALWSCPCGWFAMDSCSKYFVHPCLAQGSHLLFEECSSKMKPWRGSCFWALPVGWRSLALQWHDILSETHYVLSLVSPMQRSSPMWQTPVLVPVLSLPDSTTLPDILQCFPKAMPLLDFRHSAKNFLQFRVLQLKVSHSSTTTSINTQKSNLKN